jgi:hypothetical protein
LDYHKKVGMVVMVASVAVVVIALATTENACHGYSTPTVHYVTQCMRIYLFEDIPDNSASAQIEYRTKYAIAALSCSFGLGLLWYAGALPVPRMPARNSSAAPAPLTEE